MSAKGSLPTPLETALRQQARTLWEAGESYGAIESELGINPATLKSWRKRDAWARPTESVASPVKVIDLVTTEEAEDVPENLVERAIEYEQNVGRSAVVLSRRIAKMGPDEILKNADRVKKLDDVSRRALRIERPPATPNSVIQIGVLIDGPAKPLPSMTRPQKALPAVESESD